MRQAIEELAGVGIVGEPERARKRQEENAEAEPGVKPAAGTQFLPMALDDGAVVAQMPREQGSCHDRSGSRRPLWHFKEKHEAAFRPEMRENKTIKMFQERVPGTPSNSETLAVWAASVPS